MNKRRTTATSRLITALQIYKAGADTISATMSSLNVAIEAAIRSYIEVMEEQKDNWTDEDQKAIEECRKILAEIQAAGEQ